MSRCSECRYPRFSSRRRCRTVKAQHGVAAARSRRRCFGFGLSGACLSLNNHRGAALSVLAVHDQFTPCAYNPQLHLLRSVVQQAVRRKSASNRRPIRQIEVMELGPYSTLLFRVLALISTDSTPLDAFIIHTH